ncbi:hypothetical protein HZB89_00575 [archaeon]|nr:hypothetical protein [archaeon]
MKQTGKNFTISKKKAFKHSVSLQVLSGSQKTLQGKELNDEAGLIDGQAVE